MTIKPHQVVFVTKYGKRAHTQPDCPALGNANRPILNVMQGKNLLPYCQRCDHHPSWVADFDRGKQVSPARLKWDMSMGSWEEHMAAKRDMSSPEMRQIARERIFGEHAPA
jgi:hypothetical protein